MDEKRFSLNDIFEACKQVFDDIYCDDAYENGMEHTYLLNYYKKSIAEKLGFRLEEKKEDELNAFEKFSDEPVTKWVYCGDIQG